MKPSGSQSPRLYGLAKIHKGHVPVRVENKLIQINSLHLSLNFTVERETDSSIPFLNKRIHRKNGKLSSEWFTNLSTQD